MANDTARVACGKCKRTYSWKPERAGKKARCQCGNIIAMPLHPPGAKEAEPVDDLYALSELAAEADKAVVNPTPIRAVPAIAPVTASAAKSRALNYRTPNRSDESGLVSNDGLHDPIRDLFVPIGLIITGAVGSLAYACLETKLGLTSLAIVSALTAVLTVVKIGILIGAALMLAPMLGISFGLLGSAVLKFASIVIFIDSAELWVNVLLRATGGISATGRAPIYIIVVWLGLGLVLMAGLCAYLFSLDASEASTFAILMAILSWIIGLMVSVVLFFALGAMAVAVVAGHSPTTPMPITAPMVSSIPIGAARAIAGPPPATAVPAGPIDFDSAIARRIHPPNGRSEVIGANKWIQMSGRTGANSATNQLISKMYGAGAVNVYIDLFGGMRQPRIPGAVGPLMYVELPAGNDKIAACVQVAQAYRSQTGQSPTSPADAVTKQFLVVDLER